jgi:hypothetical protein
VESAPWQSIESRWDEGFNDLRLGDLRLAQSLFLRIWESMASKAHALLRSAAQNFTYKIFSGILSGSSNLQHPYNLMRAYSSFMSAIALIITSEARFLLF